MDEAEEGVSGPLRAVRDALTESRSLTLQEVAEAADVAPDVLAELFEASGRQRERYGDEDLEYARTLAELLQLMPASILVRAGRVRSRHLSSVVVNDLAVVRDAIIQPMLANGISVDEIAGQLTRASAELVPLIARLLALDYRGILLDLLDTEQVVQASRTGSAEVDLAVGFVDLVGFTQLSARTDPGDVGEVLTAFEDLVHAIAREHEDVRVAKFIGDAAMLVCGDTAQLARALYRIVTDRREGIEEVGRRAGLAAGPVITREGDFYGATVNYAARLTDVARPHTLVAANDTREVLGDDWEVSWLGTVELRGVGRAKPIRLRWHGAGDESGDGPGD